MSEQITVSTPQTDCCTTGSEAYPHETPRRRVMPRVDVVEHADEVRLRVDLPGADPKAIDLSIEDGVLTITAPQATRSYESGSSVRFLLQESIPGDYRRRFEVGPQIDSTKITAAYRDGVLDVHLPKTESATPRTIPIAVTK